MKKVLFVIAFFSTSLSFGQITIPKNLRNILALPPPTGGAPVSNAVTCDPVSLSNCNYISNPGLVPSQTYYTNPNAYWPFPFDFDNNEHSLIPGWETATGTPQVWDGVLIPNIFTEYPDPPVNTTGYFCGYAGGANILTFNGTESVVQKIPALSPSHTYTLNFFKKNANWPGYSTVDHFRIVLMHCSDYHQTFRTNISGYNFYKVPTLPANSQIIYCENNVSNGTSWEQAFIKFTPNQNYDMMWIYPLEDEANQNQQAFIFASFPELIDVTNFNAGPTPNSTPPNCNVTIGPVTPNCGPTGAVFTWTHGNTTITAPPNQQIQVDASNPANLGTWTLTMTLPGTVTTNSTCGEQNFTISASVNVFCCNAPTATISPSGPVEYYYIYGEFNKTLPFTSSNSTGNQWYVDGLPVAGATNQTFDYYWITVNYTDEIHQISVANNNCMSAPVTVHFIPNGPNSCPIPIVNKCYLPEFNNPFNYCENSNSYMRAFDMGPLATYSWQLYPQNGGNPVIITSINQNIANISIGNPDFVSVIAKSELNGHIKYSDYFFEIHSSTFSSLVTNYPLMGCFTTGQSVITLSTQGSQLDNEFYDFGNADVISVNPPLSFPYGTTQHTVYMSGAFSGQPRQIVLQRNGINSYNATFTNNNFADCWNIHSNLYFSPNCFSKSNSSVTDKIEQFKESKAENNSGKSPFTSLSNISLKNLNLQENIQIIEIYNTTGQLLKKVNSDLESYEVLRSKKVIGLMPGLYFVRILYKDKSSKTIKQFLQ